MFNVMIPIALKLVACYATYGYTALSDWIRREVNPLVWVLPSLSGIITNIILFNNVMQTIDNAYKHIMNLHFHLSILVSIVVILLLAILSFVLGLIGGADVFAVITFVILYPSNIELMFLVQDEIYLANSKSLLIGLFLPPIVIIFALYVLIMLFYLTYNVIRNLIHKKELKKYQLSKLKIMYFVIFGKIVKAGEVINKRFYYPLYIPGVIERFTFNIEEDDTLWINKLKKLPADAIVVVTWGIPMVTFISMPIFIYSTLQLILLIIQYG